MYLYTYSQAKNSRAERQLDSHGHRLLAGIPSGSRDFRVQGPGNYLLSDVFTGQVSGHRSEAPGEAIPSGRFRL